MRLALSLGDRLCKKSNAFLKIGAWPGPNSITLNQPPALKYAFIFYLILLSFEELVCYFRSVHSSALVSRSFRAWRDQRFSLEQSRVTSLRESITRWRKCALLSTSGRLIVAASRQRVLAASMQALHERFKQRRQTRTYATLYLAAVCRSRTHTLLRISFARLHAHAQVT